jgi:hypothetical protein
LKPEIKDYLSILVNDNDDVDDVDNDDDDDVDNDDDDDVDDVDDVDNGVIHHHLPTYVYFFLFYFYIR